MLLKLRQGAEGVVTDNEQYSSRNIEVPRSWYLDGGQAAVSDYQGNLLQL